MAQSDFDKKVADFSTECITKISAYMEYEYSMKLAPMPNDGKRHDWRDRLRFNPEYEYDAVEEAKRIIALMDCETLYRHNIVFWYKTSKRVAKYLASYSIKNPIYELPKDISEQELKEQKKSNFRSAEGILIAKLTTENEYDNLENKRLSQNARKKTEKKRRKRIHRDVFNEFRDVNWAAKEYRFGHKKPR